MNECQLHALYYSLRPENLEFNFFLIEVLLTYNIIWLTLE